MTVEVLLFALLREAAGTARRELTLAEGATAGDVVAAIRGELAGRVPERLPVSIAVNEEFVDSSRVLLEGDTVALIPPVSGG